MGVMKRVRCLKCGLLFRFRSWERLSQRIRAHALTCWGQG